MHLSILVGIQYILLMHVLSKLSSPSGNVRSSEYTTLLDGSVQYRTSSGQVVVQRNTPLSKAKLKKRLDSKRRANAAAVSGHTPAEDSNPLSRTRQDNNVTTRPRQLFQVDTEVLQNDSNNTDSTSFAPPRIISPTEDVEMNDFEVRSDDQDGATHPANVTFHGACHNAGQQAAYIANWQSYQHVQNASWLASLGGHQPYMSMPVPGSTHTPAPLSMDQMADIVFSNTDLVSQRGYEKKVPAGHEVVSKRYLTQLKELASFATNIFKSKDKKKYHPRTTLSRRFDAVSHILSPRLSQDKGAFHLATSRAAIYEEADMLHKITNEEIAKASAGSSTIGSMIHGIAADILFMQREDLLATRSKCFGGFDKGTRGDFVKTLSHYCFETEMVKRFTLDNEKSGGTNQEAAQAIKFSMDRLYLGDAFRLAGFTSDSGGGGTREGFFKYLLAEQIISDDGLVGTCAMHCLQLTFCNPATKYFGEGGVERRNIVQLIHAVFDLQKVLGLNLWRKLVSQAEQRTGLHLKDKNGKDSKFAPVLQQPVFTRWWTVGEASRFIVHNLDLLIEVTFLSIEAQRQERDSKLNKIASRLSSLFREETIVNDLKLIYCYNEIFISKHFEWLQRGDERIGGTPGYCGRNMLVRYFLMRSDLKSLCDDGWKTCNGMKLFTDDFLNKIPEEYRGDEDVVDIMKLMKKDGLIARSLVRQKEIDRELEFETETPSPGDMVPDLPAARSLATEGGTPSIGGLVRDLPQELLIPRLQQHKARSFFKCALEILDKHFERYTQQSLFLGLFGEAETARILAKKILEKNSLCADSINANASSYFCTIQNRKINLKDFAAFLDEKVDLEKVWDCPHLVKIGRADLSLIASPKYSIWSGDDGVPEEYITLKHYYLAEYAAFMTTTHYVEAGVKKSNDADNGRRTELRQTHYVLGTNITAEINRDAVKIKLARAPERGKSYKVDPKPADAELSEALICYTERLDNSVELLRFNVDKNNIYRKISDSIKPSKGDHAFETARDKTETKERMARQVKRWKKLKGNKLAREVGFEITDLTTSNFQFKALKKGHESLLRAEIEKRGICLEEGKVIADLKFRALATLLRHDEIMNRCDLTKSQLVTKLLDATEKANLMKKVAAFAPESSQLAEWNEIN